MFACTVAVPALAPPVALAARPDLAGPVLSPVRQALPDLTVVKTNNVGGLTTAGSTWTWTFAIRNAGGTTATFAAGQTVLLDNLPPSPPVSYPTVTPLPFNAPTGNLTCAVDGATNLTCLAAAGGVTIPVGSGFNVVMQATTGVPGTYVDPRAGGGVCRVDPGFAVTESLESNNDCGDTVTVVGPDLTVAKTNNVGGTATVGVAWTWTLTIQNGGTTPANFVAGQRVLVDTLPSVGVTYGPVTVTPTGGTLANTTCAIDGAFNLVCSATGIGTIIPSGGGLVVSFTATATAQGSFANPRAGGTCAVDPDLLVAENSEANNACSDTVSVPTPELTATKTNNVGGVGTVGAPWTWNVRIANAAGAATGTFTNGQRILVDTLPNAGIAYGTPSATAGGGTTGTVSCSVDGTFSLVCVAVGTVTMPAGSIVDVSFTATPSTAGSFVNPRAGGSCQVDPDNVLPEVNDANNACADTVGVSLPDLRVTKQNSTAASPRSTRRLPGC